MIKKIGKKMGIISRKEKGLEIGEEIGEKINIR